MINKAAFIYKNEQRVSPERKKILHKQWANKMVHALMNHSSPPMSTRKLSCKNSSVGHVKYGPLSFIRQ